MHNIVIAYETINGNEEDGSWQGIYIDGWLIMGGIVWPYSIGNYHNGLASIFDALDVEYRIILMAKEDYPDGYPDRIKDIIGL